MATAIQRRRGTSLQHANFTGLAGEITIDTTLNTIIVHDGVTAGGIRLAKHSEVVSASEGDITAVNTLSGSGLTGGVTSGAANIAIDYENLQGNLIPSADNTYSLGSPTKVWKDVYVGPGSLYVNGQKVLEDNSGTIVVGADAGQNLALNTSGGGDIEFNAVGGGTIALKSNVVVSSGISFSSAGGNTVGFNSNINLTSNQINNLGTPVSATDAATKAYVDTASDIVRTSGAQTIAGDKTFSDNIVVGGSLTVQGTTTTVNSETISLADNIIDLNSNFTSGNPTENAGIRIQRGDEAAVQIRWNEADDHWEVYDGSATTKLALDTDDLAEGSSNLYYTSARANADFDTRLATKDTDDVSEGASNLYYTDARADARIALQTGASLDLSSKDTDELSEGSTNQYYTDARARSAISAGGDLSYNSTTGVMSFTQRSDAQVRSLISASGDISYDQTTGVISFTNDAGDIESVTAGSGLTGGGTSGAVTLAVDTTTIATKAYVDSQVQSKDALSELSGSTDDVAEGSTNLYHTTARARASVSGGTGIDYNSTTGAISVDSTIATKDYANTAASAAVSAVIDSAPAALDTLNELAAALGDDANFSTTVTNSIATKLATADFDATANTWIGTQDTDDLAEGATNQYFTTARARSSISAGGDLSYNSTTGVVSYTTPTTIASLSNHDTGDLAEGTNKYYTDARARAAISVSGDLSYDSSTGVISFTNDAGDIESVGAGAGLTGGGATGAVTLNVGAGTGITVAADSVSVDMSVFDTGDLGEGSNLYWTTARGEAMFDTKLAAADTDDLSEGASNLYYTSARAIDDANVAISNNTTDNLSEGTGSLYFTDARARNAISAGGDLSYNNTTGVMSFTERTDAEVRGLLSASGDLSYNSSTGVFSVTTYKSTDFDTDFGNKTTDSLSEGSNNLYYTTTRANSAIDTRVNKAFVDALNVDADTLDGINSTNFARTDVAETFTSDVTVQGNFTVTGTTTTVNTETINLADNIITLNSNETGAPSQNAGLEVERGTSTNVSLVWDESADKWTVGTGTFVAGTFEGDLTGDVTGTVSSLSNHSTSNLSEGTNLYYTAARFNSAFAGKSTSDLSEGTNLYHTTARVSTIISNDVDKAFVDALNVDSATLNGQAGSYYRNASNLNAGTIPSARLPDLLVSDFAGSAIQTSAEAFSDSDTVLMTAAAANDRFQIAGSYQPAGSYVTTNHVQALHGTDALSISGQTLTLNKADGTSESVTLPDSDGQTLGWNGSTGVLSISGGNSVDLDGRYELAGTNSVDYINSASFNTSTGVLTLSGVGNAGATVDLDGRYQGAGSYVTTSSAQALRATDAIQVSNDTITLFKGDGTSESVTISDAYENYGSWTISDGSTSEAITSGATLTVTGSGASSVSYNSSTNTLTISSTDTDTNTWRPIDDTPVNGATTESISSNWAYDHQNTTGVGVHGSTTAATANRLAHRDASGNLTANVFNGTATAARYADLAEKYATDAELEAGTVVVFGGDAEVTACSSDAHHAVAGVISTDPAYMMNSEAEGQYVALTGRVPVKVTGPVAKGDLMVTSSVAGHAKADNNAQAGRILGKAISAHEGEGEGVVEVLITLM